MSTEGDLRDWRHGPVQAERLCAGLLRAEGYQDVDPQAPLGGPDGAKDILAKREGELWVAAAFFPATGQRPRQIAKKFQDDSAGVGRNDAYGFVFFVNQRMTVGDRKDLAENCTFPVEIYHLERIRSVLDAPRGYGLRLEHLGIEMSREEQVAFFSELQQDVARQLLASEQRFGDIDRKLDLVLHRTTLLTESVVTTPSSLSEFAGNDDLVGDLDTPTARLTVETLSLVHRIVADESAPNAGMLRSVQVFVGNPKDPTFVPSPPDEIPKQIVALLLWWRETYPALRVADRETIIVSLAKLHHGLVSIHPFLDGNGRVARMTIDLAARDLLGMRIGSELVQPPREYFASLHKADNGDLSQLAALISAALT